VHPDVHLFETHLGPHLFVVNGSAVYTLGETEKEKMLWALHAGEAGAVRELLREFSIESPPLIDDVPVVSPPLRAVSLAVAQTCNLGCTLLLHPAR
jgi:uncharacterized protein